MKQAKWIWTNAPIAPDQHAIFACSFLANKNSTYKISISADGIYSVELNGQLVGFSQCSDFPNYKYFDTFLLKKGLVDGLNNLEIRVWYIGDDFSCYYKASPKLYFEIEEDSKVIAYSSKATKSRLDRRYAQTLQRKITPQLGFGFDYDANQINADFHDSIVVDENIFSLEPRPTKPLKLGKTHWGKQIKRGENYAIFEIPETAGLLQIRVNSEKKSDFCIVFRENLENGRLTQEVGGRNFSLLYCSKPGENNFLEPLRRIAARYLEVRSSDGIPDSFQIGLAPVNADVNWIEGKLADPLDQRIYDACINTLKLCMHEHYEDCPWREQSLYALDSRNQMLCEYHSLKESTYQRANLILLSRSLDPERGLLTICAPSSVDLRIPSFSLFYILAVAEYVEHTKDYSLFQEVSPCIKTLWQRFEKQMDETGLLHNFTLNGDWNFYEWTAGSDGSETVDHDLLLNAIFVYVRNRYNAIFGDTFDLSKIRKAMQTVFFDEEKGSYLLSDGKNATYSELGNAFALLAGIAPKGTEKTLLQENSSLVKASLSMKGFLYDAILESDENGKEIILNDIRKTYLPMIESGNTVWETELGWKDFDNAGSLCHGWSALPAYYFHRFGMITQK